MLGLEHIEKLLGSDDWRDIERGLDHLQELGDPALTHLVPFLTNRLPALSSHSNWRVRHGIAQVLANLDRVDLLGLLSTDRETRVAMAAQDGLEQVETRARERAAKEERERSFERRLERLRRRHGDAATSEVRAMVVEELASVAERIGHDLLGTVSILQRVERILAMRVPEEQLGPQDWALSVGTLPKLTRYLRSFAEDFREFLSAPTGAEPVRLADLVRSAVSDAEAALSEGPRAKVVQEVGPSLKAMLPVGTLARCVSNLVRNGIEAAPDGTVRVRAWAEGQDLRLRVADDGPGMTEEMRARCFEPFQSTKRNLASRPCGLGLAIVRRKIEEHLGGRVLVESELGRGSTFTLEVPGVVIE